MCFARTACPEAVGKVSQDLVFLEMCHKMSEDDELKELARDGRRAGGAIVFQ